MTYRYSTNASSATPGTLMKLLKDHLTTYGWRIMGSSSGSGGSYTQSTTITAGSNGVSLPTGTINVSSASSFPTSGTCILYNSAGAAQSITYTGKTGTTLTGCTGGTGTMATGGLVTYDWWSSTTLAEASGAWIRLQMPVANSVNREFLFQRGTTGVNYWNIRYSYTTPFTGGSPSTTTVPTAASSKVILDGTAAGGLLFNDTSGMTGMVVCDDASPYGFALSANTTALYGDGIFVDPMVSGTYDSGDTDPYVIGAGNLLYSTTNMGSDTTTGLVQGHLKKGLAGEGFVTIGAMCYYVQGVTTTSAYLGVDATSGNDPILDLNWGRIVSATAPRGWKGMSTFFKLALVSRNKKDTVSTNGSGSKNFMYLSTGDMFLVRWNGAVPA